MDGTVNISIKDFESFKECDRMYRELLQELQKKESCIKIVSINNSYSLIQNVYGQSYHYQPANTTTHTYFISNDSALKEIESHYQVEMAIKQNQCNKTLESKDDEIKILRERIELKGQLIDECSGQVIDEKKKKKWYQIF